MNRQQVPALDKRPETGAMRFGDDWTGVFIRGDSAICYRAYLMMAREELPEPRKRYLDGLIEVLSEADERNFYEQNHADNPSNGSNGDSTTQGERDPDIS